MRAAIMVLYEDNGSYGSDAGLSVEAMKIKDLLKERAVKVIPFSMDHSEEVKSVLGSMVKFVEQRNNGHSEPQIEESPEDMKFWKQVKKNLGPVLKEGMKEVWLGKERYDAQKKASNAPRS